MQLPGGTRFEVQLDLLRQNVRGILSMVAPAGMMAVIKGDAYGHGAVITARIMLDCGVDRFGVARLSEGVSLRGAGIGGHILVLSITPPCEVPALLKHSLAQTIGDIDHARGLSAAAVLAGGLLPVHIKLDTGMSRLGLDCMDDDILPSLIEISRLPGLIIEGCYTHFSSADVGDFESDEFTREQTLLFDRVTAAARREGVNLGLLHACNSSGTLRFKEAYYDLVRPASLMLGLDPMPSDRHVAHPFEPVGCLSTEISLIKALPPGRAVSYSRLFHTDRHSLIATLPMGYADGLPRAFSGELLIRGRRAPVVGRICMDQTMVDVTDIPDAAVGDRVIVLGRQGSESITATELAERSGGGYVEIVSRIGRRVPIYYTEGGRVVAELDYINDGLKMMED